MPQSARERMQVLRSRRGFGFPSIGGYSFSADGTYSTSGSTGGTALGPPTSTGNPRADDLSKQVHSYAGTAISAALVAAPEVVPFILAGVAVFDGWLEASKFVTDWFSDEEDSDADSANVAANVKRYLEQGFLPPYFPSDIWTCRYYAHYLGQRLDALDASAIAGARGIVAEIGRALAATWSRPLVKAYRDSLGGKLYGTSPADINVYQSGLTSHGDLYARVAAENFNVPIAPLQAIADKYRDGSKSGGYCGPRGGCAVYGDITGANSGRGEWTSAQLYASTDANLVMWSELAAYARAHSGGLAASDTTDASGKTRTFYVPGASAAHSGQIASAAQQNARHVSPSIALRRAQKPNSTRAAVSLGGALAATAAAALKFIF